MNYSGQRRDQNGDRGVTDRHLGRLSSGTDSGDGVTETARSLPEGRLVGQLTRTSKGAEATLDGESHSTSREHRHGTVAIWEAARAVSKGL